MPDRVAYAPTTDAAPRGTVVDVQGVWELVDPDRLMISDPRAVRGMANPVRLVAVDELYRSQRPATATELAQLTGVTPSAMSYHLRELEGFGIIRRGEVVGDGRERPWLAAAANYSLVASDDDDATLRAVLIDSRLTPMRQRMEEVLQRRSAIPEAERSEPFMVLATGSLLLDSDELAAMQAEIDEVFTRYEHLGADREDADGLRRARYMWSVLPERVGPDD